MGDYIRSLVHKYVLRFDTRDPFKLAKFLNIEVQLGTPGCSGCYMFLKNHRYIFLDQNLEEREIMQVMAHELGHAILHKKQNCYFIRNKTLFLNSKTELEANLFAAELLIDEDIIIENSGCTTSQLSRLLGYEERLIELRIQNSIYNS